MHNTKGLEFERVIVTGLEEGVFPLIRGDGPLQDEELEEERRLFYVGVTRAERELHLTACTRRSIYGQRRDQAASRFLDEIPAELITRTGADPTAAAALSDVGRFPTGAEVYHDDYGTGVITRRWNEGGTWFVAVRFHSSQEASFALRYASLERVGS